MSLKAVIKDVDRSFNVMLIPSECEDVMKMWGIAEVEGVPIFGQVKGVKVNMKNVIESYCYGSGDDYRILIERLIGKIS